MPEDQTESAWSAGLAESQHPALRNRARRRKAVSERNEIPDYEAFEPPVEVAVMIAIPGLDVEGRRDQREVVTVVDIEQRSSRAVAVGRAIVG
jgi:hypothetical protein